MTGEKSTFIQLLLLIFKGGIYLLEKKQRMTTMIQIQIEHSNNKETRGLFC